ncbi:hypothetical protein ACQR16_08555 [Bradyrhizobium oligotrophicum]|uniref:hypothetical protein n=1 Tax=Bradyrhizobium oligotrophicum TaxID=44255 RepID=UPI003EBC7C75
MGLYVHSLSRLPLDVERDYYLYVLDYGWHEPLGDALHQNFRRMADLAAKNKAFVLAGTDSRAFSDEILSVHFDGDQFSWDKVNGQSRDDLLPALMISTIHPQQFRKCVPQYRPKIASNGLADDKVILIPLRSTCKNTSDVMSLIERIFRDIAEKRPLAGFAIAEEINAGTSGAISDALILKPTLWGVGIDLKAAWMTFKQQRAQGLSKT